MMAARPGRSEMVISASRAACFVPPGPNDAVEHFVQRAAGDRLRRVIIMADDEGDVAALDDRERGLDRADRRGRVLNGDLRRPGMSTR